MQPDRCIPAKKKILIKKANSIYNNIILKKTTSLHSWWVTGITDSEGNFTINYNSKQNKATFAFKVTQKDDTMLMLLRLYFNEGSILIDNKQFNTYKFQISNVTTLLKVVIPHFDKHPLQGSKQLDYEDWKKAILIYSKEKDINKVLEIKANMNSKRSFVQRWEYTTNRTILLQPEWIQAFVNGEGSFQSYIKLGIVRNKESLITYFRLEVAQNSYDAKLLDAIRLFFNQGYIKPKYDFSSLEESKKASLVTRYIVNGNKEIVEFFNKYPMIGPKQLDYEDWVKLINMKAEKAHLTNKGLETMINIKRRMNSGRSVLNSVKITENLKNIPSDRRNYSQLKKDPNKKAFLKKLLILLRDLSVILLLIILYIISLLTNDADQSDNKDDINSSDTNNFNSSEKANSKATTEQKVFFEQFDKDSDNCVKANTTHETREDDEDYFPENIFASEEKSADKISSSEDKPEVNLQETLLDVNVEKPGANSENEVVNRNLEAFKANQELAIQSEQSNVLAEYEKNGYQALNLEPELSLKLVELISSIVPENNREDLKDKNILNLTLGPKEIEILKEKLKEEEEQDQEDLELEREFNSMDRSPTFVSPTTPSPLFKVLDDLEGKEVSIPFWTERMEKALQNMPDVSPEVINYDPTKADAETKQKAERIRQLIFSRIAPVDESQRYPRPYPGWIDVPSIPSDPEERKIWAQDNEVRKQWASKYPFLPEHYEQIKVAQEEKQAIRTEARKKDFFLDEDSANLDKLFDEDSTNK